MDSAIRALLFECEKAVKYITKGSDRPHRQLGVITTALTLPEYSKTAASLTATYKRLNLANYASDEWILNNVIDLNMSGLVVGVSSIYYQLAKLQQYPKTEARLCARLLEVFRAASCPVTISMINYWRVMAYEELLPEEVVAPPPSPTPVVVKKLAIANEEDLEYHNMASGINERLRKIASPTESVDGLFDIIRTELDTSELPFGVRVVPGSAFDTQLKATREKATTIIEGAEIAASISSFI